MICFGNFCQKKKLFLILGVAHTDPFLAPVAPKDNNFQTFYKIFFFRTTALQHKLLTLIETPKILKIIENQRTIVAKLGFML